MLFRRSSVLALALASLTLSAHAVDNIRPGLWEFRSTHLSVGGLPDMSAQMAMLQQQRYMLALGTASVHLFGSLLLTVAGIKSATILIATRAI